MFSLATFEHQLVMYVTADDKVTFSKPFDLHSVPVVSHEQALAEERTKKLTSATPTLKAPTTSAKKPAANGAAEGIQSAALQAQQYTQQLASIPEIKPYGPALKSSQIVELTETETEYVVSAVKHIFKDHIVLQYDIKNTLPETVLEDVSVVATPADEDLLEEEFIIPVASLKTEEPGTVYVSFKQLSDTPFVATSFTNTLKFTSKEIDPSTGEPDTDGYEDEYQVEDLELSGSDYVLPAYAGSFDHIWEQTGANGEEASETLQLTHSKSITGKLNFFFFFLFYISSFLLFFYRSSPSILSFII
jgi:coatomer subunit gamma